MKANYMSIYLLLCSIALPVWAQPKVTIETIAEKDITVTEDGHSIVKRVKADTVEPGEILIYTVRYANTGNEKAANVAVTNPVPAGTSYIADTATGAHATILFSVDGGKTYKQPSLLTYEVVTPVGQTQRLRATPGRYTHIRWVLKQVLPGEKGTVGFKVKVK